MANATNRDDFDRLLSSSRASTTRAAPAPGSRRLLAALWLGGAAYAAWSDGRRSPGAMFGNLPR